MAHQKSSETGNWTFLTIDEARAEEVLRRSADIHRQRATERCDERFNLLMTRFVELGVGGQKSTFFKTVVDNEWFQVLFRPTKVEVAGSPLAGLRVTSNQRVTNFETAESRIHIKDYLVDVMSGRLSGFEDTLKRGPEKEDGSAIWQMDVNSGPHLNYDDGQITITVGHAYEHVFNTEQSPAQSLALTNDLLLHLRPMTESQQDPVRQVLPTNMRF